ncbi:MAG: hypothetical protein ABSE51_05065 [Terracidiphilus sp.]|jgi:hypothetical protein
MKKWILTFVAIAVALGGIGYAWYRIHQRQQWREAYGDALDAFKRAYDYRDAGVLLFEPRLKDFQTADDRLQRMSQIDYKTQGDAEILHLCGDEIGTYRDESRIIREALELGKAGLKNAESAMESQKSVDKEMAQCLSAR